MELLAGLYLQYKFYIVKIMIKKMVPPRGMAQETTSHRYVMEAVTQTCGQSGIRSGVFGPPNSTTDYLGIPTRLL